MQLVYSLSQKSLHSSAATRVAITATAVARRPENFIVALRE